MSTNGSIDEESIKTCSGQFDLESVFKLTMCRMGLRVMENLAACVNLTQLDLSHNRIGKIQGLDALQQLRTLNLRDNEIGKLENVSKLSSLEVLELQGNQISSLDELQCCAKLPTLRQLFFRDFRENPAELENDERNPICDHPAYRVTVRRMLPKLASLDGERTALADAAEEALGAGAEAEEMQIATPKPWFSKEELSLGLDKLGDPKGRVSIAGVEEFEQGLQDCKRLSARAKILLDEYKP